MQFPPPFVRLLHSSTWRRDWFPVLLPPVSPPFPVPPLSEFPASPPVPGLVDLPSLYGVALHCGRRCGRPGGLCSFATVTFFFVGSLFRLRLFASVSAWKRRKKGTALHVKRQCVVCQCVAVDCAARRGVERLSRVWNFSTDFVCRGCGAAPCRPQSRAGRNPVPAGIPDCSSELCRSGVLCRRTCFSMGRRRPCLLAGPLERLWPVSAPSLCRAAGLACLLVGPLFAGPPGAIRCGRGGACCRASCGRCPAAGPPATCCPPWRRAPGESAPPRRRGRAAAQGPELRPARRAGPGP